MVQPPHGASQDGATPDGASIASPSWTSLQQLHIRPPYWPQIMPTFIVQHFIPPVVVVNQHFHFHGQQLLQPLGSFVGSDSFLPRPPAQVSIGGRGDVSETNDGREVCANTAGCEQQGGNHLDDILDDTNTSAEDIMEDTATSVKDVINDMGAESVVEISKRKRHSYLSERKRAKSSAMYSDKGFTSSMSMAKIRDIAGQRVIARSRKWSCERMAYGEWRTHWALKSSTGNYDSLRFDMCRGGVIEFFPHLLDNTAVHDVCQEMMQVNTFKQYKVRDCAPEPRLHALFCSTKHGQERGGYQYGRVMMESNPLESLPVISKLANRLAAQFALEDNQWNIGCHLVLYRDGKDSIAWHSDDTQGEDVVLSVTVDGPIANPRTICFQPAKGSRCLGEGDEQIELYPIPGDGYSMDGSVQGGYVHAMLKTKLSRIYETKRMAIIF